MGDLFSNLAVAKQGRGEMALAGCYGGPAFNMLVGLGVSFTIVAIKHYPSTHHIKIDRSDILSIATLYLSLLTSLVVNFFRGFVVDKSFGYGLLALYAVYSLCQIGLVTHEAVFEDQITSTTSIPG